MMKGQKKKKENVGEREGEKEWERIMGGLGQYKI